ncbi:MAG: RsmB/NOP family class I SAM-dependent RNA methyltransferase [Rhodospirillaceae bacterium]|nr:RsmB/NOP family class I SAM-dependent RNA methyltransferase [Rhodospirillaceae bacterium]
MTPGARLQATIELLDALIGSTAPADTVIAGFLRQRRYVGSGDRRAILERVYALLRRRAALAWWIERVAGPGRPAPSGRRLMLAALMLLEGNQASAVGSLFNGQRYCPAPLNDEERVLLDALDGQSLHPADQPEAVRLELPDWAEPGLRERFGAEYETEIEALNKPAALDLRANTLIGTREEAIAELAAEGVAAAPTPFSPVGMRVTKRPALATLESFKRGLVEVQDEGSQIVSLLVDARAGMKVADFCAGAGGKTLAMAASMRNKGVLVACDVAKGRLDRAAVRLRRAHVDNVQRRLLESARDPWIKRQVATFDRVLVDAPCTGSGTWRRNPDQRWRIAPEMLESLINEQRAILDQAARLVRPGGRLVYATCSFFRAENEDQIEAFIARMPGFALLPVAGVWSDVLPGECPATAPTLMLTPARHGTDGFFVAVLQKQDAPPA